LKDYILEHHIDIVAIQETKLESLPPRTLNFLSTFISNWIFKPSEGNLGGIHVGINESFYSVLDTLILNFFVIVHLRNKQDSFDWYFTVVYGPTISAKR
jgi:hypothetical protein